MLLCLKLMALYYFQLFVKIVVFISNSEKNRESEFLRTTFFTLKKFVDIISHLGIPPLNARSRSDKDLCQLFR